VPKRVAGSLIRRRAVRIQLGQLRMTPLGVSAVRFPHFRNTSLIGSAMRKVLFVQSHQCVIPAQAGIQPFCVVDWLPACEGMTKNPRIPQLTSDG
jgi:hypothetical protein